MTDNVTASSHAGASAPTAATLACQVNDGFAQWLSQSGGSLAISTYQAGKILLVGWDGRQVTFLPRQFDKPMGLSVQEGRLALATRHAILLFANAPLLAPDYLENQHGKYDALYLPRMAYFTGDLNVHDLAWTADGLWVVNTRFCCLATLGADHNFTPRWKPPFLSAIVPEDRCHLNGLAVVDGRAKYVTALGETDHVGGWRADKAKGGVVIDVETNTIVLRGLAMPHSPRWQHKQLWVLNSGAGELWAVESTNGRHVVVCALPGYLRGLCILGRYALVGLCQIRERHLFGGLPVQQRFPQLLCAVALIDLQSGQTEGMLEFTSGCQELFDVKFLPGVRRPMILNLEKDATRQAFTAPQFSYWLRPSNLIEDASGPMGEPTDANP